MGWKARRVAVGRANPEARRVRARPLHPESPELAGSIEFDNMWEKSFTYLFNIVIDVEEGWESD